MEAEEGRAGPGSPTSLRRANRSRILDVLRTDGGCSQAELARITGLAAATVSNIVRELVTDGLARVEGRGRPVQLVPTGGYLLGIDLGHRHLTLALAGLDCEPVAVHRIELGTNVPLEEGLGLIVDSFERVLADAGIDVDQVLGAGMGLPAPIDHSTGTVGALSILPMWVGMRPADLLAERLGLPVTIENDANLGALAEKQWGAGRGVNDLAYIKLSDGVGSGILVGGQIFHGRGGIAGEIGHMVVQEFGPLCRCGNRGCLETLVAARTVVAEVDQLRGPELSIARIVELARGGDAPSARILTDTGHQVGIAVASLCNVINPEMIIIGGELAQAEDLLLVPMMEAVRRNALPSVSADLAVVTAKLHEHSQLRGALLLASMTYARDALG